MCHIFHYPNNSMQYLKILFEPQVIISALGVIGVIAIIFAETGLFFGFFLPGDSLLFTAGFLASQGYISMAWLLFGAFVAAVLGDSVGYAFGKKIGPAIFTKDDSVFFNKKHIARAQYFYEEHGKKTIILARFIPIIRTFAPIVAGIGNMGYRTFILFNVIGGFVWTWGLLWAGYIFGSILPNPDRYILPVIIVIIIISAAPALREIFKHALK
jgi:membrane-associated protein